jgi:hypothetical protein
VILSGALAPFIGVIPMIALRMIRRGDLKGVEDFNVPARKYLRQPC